MSVSTTTQSPSPYWGILEERFAHYPSAHKFWNQVAKEIPISLTSGTEVKDQVVSFCRNVKRVFDAKKSIISTLNTQAEKELERGDRLSKAFCDTLIRRDKRIPPEVHDLYIELMNTQITGSRKHFYKLIGRVSSLKEQLLQDRTTKILARCVRVAYSNDPRIRSTI